MKACAVLALLLSLAPRLSAAEPLFAPGRTGNVSGPENQFYEPGTIFRTSAPRDDPGIPALARCVRQAALVVAGLRHFTAQMPVRHSRF